MFWHKGHNYLTVFVDLMTKRAFSRHRQIILRASVCWGIAASQRPSEGDLACSHRHYRRLHQGGERQLGERPGGVLLVPCHPECCGGL